MRLRQGRTEVDLAQSSGVERSHLSRIERNISNPNLETFMRLLRGLGVESIFIYLPRK
jgi:transcriptional regulator with XRE-family HTH domain